MRFTNHILQLHEMQVKFRETKELMIEHQEELKILKSRLE